MSGFLLDANVLIALAWPAHDSHATAHKWFEKHARMGWATCPLTECAFVQVISNPAFSPDALTPQSAIALLSENLKHPTHQFWTDNIDLGQALRYSDRKLTGHQQVTDAYLLGLAIHHKGKLATFDRGLGSVAGKARITVELID